jgi:hypothetical protein
MTILIDPGAPLPPAGSAGTPLYGGIGNTAPTSAKPGDLWIDTAGGTLTLKVRQGTAWTTLQRLDAAGKIPASLLTVQPMEYKGTLDVTAAYVAAPSGNPLQPGDFGVVRTSGAPDPSWAAVGITARQEAGNLLIWDGSAYQSIEHNVDLALQMETATATAGQTTWKLSRTPGHSLFLELNGALLAPTTDYTRAADTITFLAGLTAGDEITARYF